MKIEKTLSALAASVLAASVLAQGNSEAGDVQAGDEARQLARPTASTPSPVFSALPLCRVAEGEAEVLKPGSGDWEKAEEGRFYPLGSAYRTRAGGRLVLAFGQDSTAAISGESSFATRRQALGEKTRGVILAYGTVDLALAGNMREGAFFVTAPGFVVKNPAGESRYVYETVGDGDKATVRCVTGSLSVEGRHFDIPTMRAADEVVIRTSHDHLVTFLYGTSGDYVVKLDQGVHSKDEVDDDGNVVMTAEKRTSDWHLSPKTKVVISRCMPALGERMSVHTMAFDAAGERQSECYFCEGRAEINSGELVAKDKLSSEELAKRAAEATTDSAADDQSSGDSEDGGNNGNGNEGSNTEAE